VSDPLKQLEEAGRIIDGAIRTIRRIWETEEEMHRRIEAEVMEEFRLEPPSAPKPGGPRWLPTYLANWFPYRGRSGRRWRR
jgi:hypothetical protein